MQLLYIFLSESQEQQKQLTKVNYNAIKKKLNQKKKKCRKRHSHYYHRDEEKDSSQFNQSNQKNNTPLTQEYLQEEQISRKQTFDNHIDQLFQSINFNQLTLNNKSIPHQKIQVSQYLDEVQYQDDFRDVKIELVEEPIEQEYVMEEENQ